MKGLLLALLTAGGLPLGDAIQLASNPSPAVVHAPVQRIHSAKTALSQRKRELDQMRRRNVRRADDVSVSLGNAISLYYANVSLGTPGQEIALHVDTGSSDLWVNTPSSNICQQEPDVCAYFGSYTANSSSSYSFLNSDFSIRYQDNSGASGDYVADTLTINSVTLDNFEFGIGYSSSSEQGIMGLGYRANEAIVTSGLSTYANLPVALQSAGAINTVAYSLWLNDLDASSGNLLFGGVDSAQYTGELATLPILTVNGLHQAFYITLTGIGENGNAGSVVSDIAAAVLLDSGTTLIYLPNAIADALISKYNGQYNANFGGAVVDCSLASSSDTVDFTFSGKTISVGLDELIILWEQRGTEQICVFGITRAGDANSPILLGDTFLRSAYVVYDLTNNEISLAQTNFNATDTNIQEITNSQVPGASAVANPVTQVTGVATGEGRLNPSGVSAVLRGSTAAAGPAITPPPKKAIGALAVAGLAMLAV